MKKIIGSVFFLMMYFVIFSHVEAAGSVSLSASKNTVNVGDTFTVSVNLSGTSVATLTTRLTVDDQKVQYVSGPSNSNYSNGRVIYTWTDPNGGASPITGGNIATFTFTAKSAGSASFGISGDFFTPEETPANPVFSGVTVTVNNVETGNNGGGQTENQTGGQTGGQNGEQTVGQTGSQTEGQIGEQNQGTTGGETSNQTEGQTNNQDINSLINTTGNTENNGNNMIDNQPNSQNGNNNLRILQLNIEGISPKFSSRNTQYYIIIPEDINDIDVIAEPEDPRASVQIIGNTGIPLGSSRISIVVTAENGSKKEYFINVSKTGNIELANANLENLAIEDVILNPEFNPDVTDYSAEIFGEIDTLNILAVPQKENAQVSIEGNENLQYGENLIKIVVTAEDGISNKVYNVTVVKNEENIEETNAENIEENSENVYDTVDNAIKENASKESLFIIILVIAVAALLIIWVVWRRKKKEGK